MLDPQRMQDHFLLADPENEPNQATWISEREIPTEVSTQIPYSLLSPEALPSEEVGRGELSAERPTAIPERIYPEYQARESWYRERPSHLRRTVPLLALVLCVVVGGTLTSLALFNKARGQMVPGHEPKIAAPPPSSYDQWVKQNGIMFGFDAQHSGFNALENTLNTTNVSHLTLAWTSDPLGENYFSSPVITNGLAYVASSSGRLYALDLATGHTRWAAGTPHTTSSANFSTPAVFNGLVYVSLQDQRLSAFDALSGKVRWTSLIENLNSSPIIADGLVLVTDADGVSAFDAATGQSRWASLLPTNSASPVAVADGVVYVNVAGNGANHGRIYALDAETGAVRWISDLSNGGTDTNSSPTVEYGLVYVGSAAGGVMAFDAANGHLLWLSPATGLSSGASPEVANGVVYIAENRIYAFDAKTGATLWTSPVVGAYNNDSPLVANGVLYVCSAATNGSPVGSVYALNATTGEVLWTSPPTGGQIFTTPAVANGVLYVASGDQDGAVYAFHLSQ